MLASLMNFVFPYGSGILYIFIALLLSWASSTLIESIVLEWLLHRQGNQTRFVAVMGWTSVVQVLSTPFSFAVALIIFGGMIGILPLPQYLDVLQLSFSLLWNPLGFFLGFFLVPVVLEYFLWRGSWLQINSKENPAKLAVRIPPSKLFCFSGVIIANACSFLFAFLLQASLLPYPFALYGGLTFVVLIVGVFVWFLYTTQGVVSLRAPEQPIECVIIVKGVQAA
ncbi:MAG: hypothetical protein ACFE89_11340 [Candidatus Hodarchaeota archaeon]